MYAPNAFYLLLLLVLCAESKTGRPNVLFMMTDDLRPELSVYGRPHAITPNFERLARRSVIFDRAYAQVPVCFPSRHSLLTGLRPDSSDVVVWTDAQKPYIDSLMSILVRQGYNSAGIGKLFHQPRLKETDYTHGRWHGEWFTYQNDEERLLNSSVTPDSTLSLPEFRDHEIATRAINKLYELHHLSENENKPFLLTIGFKQPHLQYHLPRQYFDMYRDSEFLQNILHSDDKEHTFPDGVPLMNYRCCGQPIVSYMNDEGRKPSVENSGPLQGKMSIPARARYELMWGYLGGVSFLDAMLGRVLNTLEELNILDNTIIVFTSDHGTLHNSVFCLYYDTFF